MEKNRILVLYTGSSDCKESVYNAGDPVRSQGQEDPLEKEMEIQSSTIAWKSPRTEEPGGYNPWGHKESDTTERLHLLTILKVLIKGMISTRPDSYISLYIEKC